MVLRRRRGSRAGSAPGEIALEAGRAGCQPGGIPLVIRRALEGLNERQRMAVVLNKYEDMNYAEIAEVMNLSVKAVKSLLSRARENLRAALKAYVYMDGQPVSQAPEE